MTTKSAPKAKTTFIDKQLIMPIGLMVGPAIGIALTIFLYAVVAFVFSSFETSPGIVHQFLNGILFVLGLCSVTSLVPCFIIGLVLLVTRLTKKK